MVTETHARSQHAQWENEVLLQFKLKKYRHIWHARIIGMCQNTFSLLHTIPATEMAVKNPMGIFSKRKLPTANMVMSG